MKKSAPPTHTERKRPGRLDEKVADNSNKPKFPAEDTTKLR